MLCVWIRTPSCECLTLADWDATVTSEFRVVPEHVWMAPVHSRGRQTLAVDSLVLCCSQCQKGKMTTDVSNNLLKLLGRETKSNLRVFILQMHFNTRCKCNPAKPEQRLAPDMRHMLLLPGGEEDRGDIQGSYSSFCYSAAEPFAALVRAGSCTHRKEEQQRRGRGGSEGKRNSATKRRAKNP